MNVSKVVKSELWMFFSIVGLMLVGLLTTKSVAGYVFPNYFLYIFLGVVVFVFCLSVDFRVWQSFSFIFYIGSIVFLFLPLIIGTVTRGVVRWIAIGPWTIQPSELVRPFLILYLSNFLVGRRLDFKNLALAGLLLLLPFILIVLQPSLGVGVLTMIGFGGVILTLEYDKKKLFYVALGVILLIPMFWFFLKPYQKIRLTTLISPEADPQGAGYNSIQSMITVGSGGIMGRGLGEGVQTQLSFLPEKHTDFIFASIAEEFGFVGSLLVIGFIGLLLFRLIKIIENAVNPVARSFVSGVFLTLMAQFMIHIGMNLGIFPITGVTLPLVSVGGSSLIATLMMLGMVIGAKKRVVA